jgi:hypothetical protein
LSRLLDFDPLTGEVVTFDYNAETDSMTIGHHQDVTPILEANRIHRLERDSKKEIKAGWLRYAAIPNIVIMKWKREHGVDFFDPNDWPKVMGLINSREYRYLKTTELNHDR